MVRPEREDLVNGAQLLCDYLREHDVFYLVVRRGERFADDGSNALICFTWVDAVIKAAEIGALQIRKVVKEGAFPTGQLEFRASVHVFEAPFGSAEPGIFNGGEDE